MSQLQTITSLASALLNIDKLSDSWRQDSVNVNIYYNLIILNSVSTPHRPRKFDWKVSLISRHVLQLKVVSDAYSAGPRHHITALVETNLFQ